MVVYFSGIAMDKGRHLKFINICECEIFLVRYFSREFDDRAFFLPSQFDALKAIEKVSQLLLCFSNFTFKPCVPPLCCFFFSLTRL